MKQFALGLLATLVTLSASANTPIAEFTVKTYISCEQDDGDQWYEIGIVPFSRKDHYMMVVVYHSDDDQSTRLIKEIPVNMYWENKEQVFETAKQDMKLTVRYRDGQAAVASFGLLKDGPGSIWIERLICYQRGDITYDRIAIPQPRISVGN
ncbi:hypothetical protein QJS83_17350 [Bdellovibrio sp. 22V]|uniref:hypothetical protein n=1 Tax=Bdellovibrio sp. 22V TaxID=3044166 RepID=UPI002543EEAD|nr:hypothetical protein [Bdellovibrio sp. 22V]WII72232.1 hypothetical protein QJS83_17350 [Bdellovibrio sp. 22V]